MLSEHLKKAQELLIISEVHLCELKCKLSAEENFITINRLRKSNIAYTQSYKSLIKLEKTQQIDENKENNKFYYLFRYAVGIRLVKDEDLENPPLMEIEAEFDACYTSIEELKNEEIEAFANNNVGYHVWPYWRELVQSTCSRMGVTPLHIPYYQMENTPAPRLGGFEDK